MKPSEANIEITRHNDALASISVMMPIWTKVAIDGGVNIKIPLLGLTTKAANDQQVDAAFEEAVKCFCMSAEKFGQGLDKELLTLGWTLVGDDSSHLDFNVGDSFALESIMETGNVVCKELEMA